MTTAFSSFAAAYPSVIEPSSQAGGGLLGDRLLRALQRHRQLAGGRLRISNLDLAPRHEALVVEPVQEVAIVLRKADNRRPRPRAEVGERGQLVVLGLLDGRINRPAVRATVRMPQARLDPLDHVVA